ncbi:MAG TPA: hypothetical protein VK775_22885 [Chthoniobacterales bacterium]|nr:hypothetical protein [Chthoniobacterales bacterium]
MPAEPLTSHRVLVRGHTFLDGLPLLLRRATVAGLKTLRAPGQPALQMPRHHYYDDAAVSQIWLVEARKAVTA